MTPLPRGICQVCGHDVALRKGDLIREHRVREPMPGEPAPPSGLVVANMYSGRVCDGSGGRPKEQAA